MSYKSRFDRPKGPPPPWGLVWIMTGAWLLLGVVALWYLF